MLAAAALLLVAAAAAANTGGVREAWLDALGLDEPPPAAAGAPLGEPPVYMVWLSAYMEQLAPAATEGAAARPWKAVEAVRPAAVKPVHRGLRIELALPACPRCRYEMVLAGRRRRRREGDVGTGHHTARVRVCPRRRRRHHHRGCVARTPAATIAVHTVQPAGDAAARYYVIDVSRELSAAAGLQEITVQSGLLRVLPATVRLLAYAAACPPQLSLIGLPPPISAAARRERRAADDTLVTSPPPPRDAGAGRPQAPRGCHREDWEVQIEDLRWKSWVYQPKAFVANKCVGECRPDEQDRDYQFSNNAFIRYTYNKLHGGAGGGAAPPVPPPCCVPLGVSPVSVIYTNKKGNIAMTSMPDISVQTCGCL